jgi:hypothetical protein
MWNDNKWNDLNLPKLELKRYDSLPRDHLGNLVPPPGLGIQKPTPGLPPVYENPMGKPINEIQQPPLRPPLIYENPMGKPIR